MKSRGIYHDRSEGLYDPSYEHDACGVGMIVNIHGEKSHELVESALKVLENMRHPVTRHSCPGKRKIRYWINLFTQRQGRSIKDIEYHYR